MQRGIQPVQQRRDTRVLFDVEQNADADFRSLLREDTQRIETTKMRTHQQDTASLIESGVELVDARGAEIKAAEFLSQ
mgnify:CR=1 FL=1